MRLVIEDQEHTLACLLRQQLFDSGAAFAACTVPHPQERRLVVEVEAEDDAHLLRDAVHLVQRRLDEVKAFLAELPTRPR